MVEEWVVIDVGWKGWWWEVRGVVRVCEGRRRMGREGWCKEIGMEEVIVERWEVG